MARVVDESREGQGVARAAALMIEAEGIGPGERRCRAVINVEGERRAESGNRETIFAGRFEFTEVCFENFLIGRVVETDVAAWRQFALMNGPARARIHELKTGFRRHI